MSCYLVGLLGPCVLLRCGFKILVLHFPFHSVHLLVLASANVAEWCGHLWEYKTKNNNSTGPDDTTERVRVYSPDGPAYLDIFKLVRTDDTVEQTFDRVPAAGCIEHALGRVVDVQVVERFQLFLGC